MFVRFSLNHVGEINKQYVTRFLLEVTSQLQYVKSILPEATFKLQYVRRILSEVIAKLQDIKRAVSDCDMTWGFLVGCKSLLLGECSWHIFCYRQIVRAVLLVQGLMHDLAKQYLLACLEAQWLSIHIFYQPFLLLKSLCLESSCTQMHPKFVILHFLLGSVFERSLSKFVF